MKAEIEVEVEDEVKVEVEVEVEALHGGRRRLSFGGGDEGQDILRQIYIEVMV
jgi:hypothetical protein